jgi:hypothetical protein
MSHSAAFVAAGSNRGVEETKQPEAFGVEGHIGELASTQTAAHTESASTASSTASDGEMRGMQGTTTCCESVSY